MLGIVWIVNNYIELQNLMIHDFQIFQLKFTIFDTAK